MNTPIYFYTDAVSAAWMERHHGLKLAAVFGAGQTRKWTVDVEHIGHLSPRAGDMIMLCNGQEAYAYNKPVKLSEGEKIIMRDGKPFIMPECEVA